MTLHYPFPGALLLVSRNLTKQVMQKVKAPLEMHPLVTEDVFSEALMVNDSLCNFVLYFPN